MTHHSRRQHLDHVRLHLRCMPDTPAVCQATARLTEQLSALGVQVWHTFQDPPSHDLPSLQDPAQQSDYEPLALTGLFWSPQTPVAPAIARAQLRSLRANSGSKPLVLFADRTQALGLGLSLLELADAWLPLSPKANDVLRALQVLQLGGCYYPRTMRQALVADLVPQDEDTSSQLLLRAELTPREAEIWALVQRGCTSRDIADHLGISARTVDAHRRSLKQKQIGISGSLAA